MLIFAVKTLLAVQTSATGLSRPRQMIRCMTKAYGLQIPPLPASLDYLSSLYSRRPVFETRRKTGEGFQRI